MVSVTIVANPYKLLAALLIVTVLHCFVALRSEAQRLPDEEVRTLRQISEKLNNTYWKKLSPDSCTKKDLNRNFDSPTMLSNVTCNCSFNQSTVCHVTNIQLKSLNLTGVLPEEFGDLPYLTEIDLVLNYINGSIPVSWARIPLVTISLLGNRISGSIPEALGNIETLEELILEDNQLGGKLPPKLGNLSRLRRFVISANNITGSIPETFGNLKNLTEFRIDGNSISGRMPDFIGNWTKLQTLDMQGTSLEGPFPSTVSSLKSLIQLRVSDLNGSNMSFPDLKDLTQINELILRNCMITGEIPNYIGEVMTHMKKIDLTFNKLTGPIPESFNKLRYLQYLYLSSNSLSGTVPDWVVHTSSKWNLDISYNNFTGESILNCKKQPSMNMIASYSSSKNNSMEWCFKKDLPCSSKSKYHSLFINCGGPMKEFAGEEYEDDSAQMGPSYFYQPSEKWACSTTGDYLETNITNYITSNNALNTTVPEIYRTARLAPLSLRYYGICLLKGVYTVKLHFAEIMYTDDHTFNSVGERIFDVLIQGQMRLKDFNIAKEAKGFGRDTVREFNDIIVSGSTLEIHLYWAGKGTTFVPARGVYGPLISAIAVTRNPDHGHSIGATLGVVAAVCMVIVLIVMFVWVKCHQKGKYLEDEELRHLKLQKGYFTLKQIKAATGNFDSANKIGEGGFGPVYKGILPDGTAIAVKQLSSKSMQGNREFMNEIGMLSALQHPNLVKLFGCCVEGNQLLLIYEYMENNSLAHALFGKEEHQPNLDWPTRHKICLGMARGLAYLHEESRLKIVHRDIKTTNVLLDKDLNAKISDFGLAKLDEKEKTHIITRIAGTIGYMAPEYATRGYLTDKADVYSFGVVMLETVSGKSNTSHLLKEDFVQLLDWAYALQERGNLLHLVDPILESNYSKEEAMTMLNLALLCTNPSPSLRPLMSTVVRMLEGKISVQESLHKQGSVKEGLKFKAFELVSHDNYSQSQSNVSGTSQGSWIQNSTSVEGSWVDSSVSFENKEESRVFSAGSRLLA